MDDGFDIAKLLKLRKLTRVISDHLTRELRAHLTTLAPLLNPKNVFGEHIRGGPKIAGKTANQALDELGLLYEAVHHTKPFNLRNRFETPIALMSASLNIQPSSYKHRATDDAEGKTITITSPLKWILSFDGFGVSRMTELLSTSDDSVGPKLQECVIHALLLHVTLDKRTGVHNILQALRFTVTTERLPEFGELPLVMISAPLSTLRPPDRVMVESTDISGTTHFEEVVDSRAITSLEDPIKRKLEELVEG